MRKALAVALILIAGVMYVASARTPDTRPPVAPPAIDLTSAFQGQTASEDAATLASMAEEIANVIEWDGKQGSPVLKTGKSLDELRTRTREFMCRGVSLGERHPKMRELVGAYLQTQLGDGGGEITPEQRAAWVTAYREIARSARHAIGQ